METFRSQDLQRQASVIQESAIREPVVITYHDRPRFVLMTIQEYDRLRGRRRQVGAVASMPESVAQQIEALAQIEDEPQQERMPAHGQHP